MANTGRELCTMLAAVVHRLATCDENLLSLLRQNMTHGEVEILVQDLEEAGQKAARIHAKGAARAKGAA